MIICESAPNEELERADPLWDKQQVVSKSYNHSHHTFVSLLLIRVLNTRTANVMSLFMDMFISQVAATGLWSLLEEGNEIMFHELAFSEQRCDNFWNMDMGTRKKTFLQQACYEERVGIVQDLIALGADPNM